MWEQSMRRDLMSEREREELVIEFNVDGLLRGDSAARVAVFKSMLNDGWGTANEVREKENLNPIEGGDELRTPLNMVPAGTQADDLDKQDPTQDPPQRAQRPGPMPGSLVLLPSPAAERIEQPEESEQPEQPAPIGSEEDPMKVEGEAA
jgi:hypothetical protein